jgi:hypothetical protein
MAKCDALHSTQSLSIDNIVILIYLLLSLPQPCTTQRSSPPCPHGKNALAAQAHSSVTMADACPDLTFFYTESLKHLGPTRRCPPTCPPPLFVSLLHETSKTAAIMQLTEPQSSGALVPVPLRYCTAMTKRDSNPGSYWTGESRIRMTESTLINAVALRLDL